MRQRVRRDKLQREKEIQVKEKNRKIRKKKGKELQCQERDIA